MWLSALLYLSTVSSTIVAYSKHSSDYLFLAFPLLLSESTSVAVVAWALTLAKSVEEKDSIWFLPSPDCVANALMLSKQASDVSGEVSVHVAALRCLDGTQ